MVHPYGYYNRTTANGAAYATETGNRMTTDGTYRYEYDDNGNRTLRYVDTDSSGTLNTGDTDITTYAWDYRNRLVTASDQATFGAAVAASVEYIYDAFNNRISKIVDADGDGTAESPVRTNFALLDGEVYLEFNGTTLTHRYMPGPSIDMNLAIEDVLTAAVLWALTDHQGTVRDVIDSSGVVQNHIKYTAFGAIESQTVPTVNYRFTYTGRELDAETGLHYYRARYYDAENGRFISEDPIAFEAGDANLYRYVGNNPGNGTDPMGMAPSRLVEARRALPSAREDLAKMEATKASYVDYHNAGASVGSEKWSNIERDISIQKDIIENTKAAIAKLEEETAMDLFTKNKDFGDWYAETTVDAETNAAAGIGLIPGDGDKVLPEIHTLGATLGAAFYTGQHIDELDKAGCIEIDFEFRHVAGSNSGLHVGFGGPTDDVYAVIKNGREIQLSSTERDASTSTRIDTAEQTLAYYKKKVKADPDDPRNQAAADRAEHKSNELKHSNHGDVYMTKSANGAVKAKNRKWHQMRVRLHNLGKNLGMGIEVFMNSGGRWHTLTTFNPKTDKEPNIGERNKNHPSATDKRSIGGIAIQVHGGEDVTAFRNIRARILARNEAGNESEK